MPAGTLFFNVQDILVHRLGIQPDMVYADLGIGGTAHFILAAAELVGKGGKVYGMDIMKSALDSAKKEAQEKQYLNIKFVWTDLEIYGAAKEVADDSIDRMSMINLLYQTKQDAHVFNEANRMLKPGGRCVVVDWLEKETPFGPDIAERTSLDKVRQMAKVVGWREISEFEPSKYHFGVVFEK